MFGVADFHDLPDCLRWRCDTVAPGTDVTGVIAGKLVPVRTHWNGEKTQPCRHAITKGKLYCPCTHIAMRGTTTVYTPLYTQAKERLVVPASALVGFNISKYAPGKLINLARSKLRCAPLKLSVPGSADQEQSWVRNLRQRCVADIELYLLHLWQDQELAKFFEVEFRPSIKTVVGFQKSDGPTETA